MKKLLIIIKKLLLYFWWQDVEKSHFIPRILNIIFCLILSFGCFSVIYLSHLNILFKLFLGAYLILSVFSFWPVSNLLDNKSKANGSVFFIFQNNFIFFSLIILIRFIIKEENI